MQVRIEVSIKEFPKVPLLNPSTCLFKIRFQLKMSFEFEKFGFECSVWLSHAYYRSQPTALYHCAPIQWQAPAIRRYVFIVFHGIEANHKKHL